MVLLQERCEQQQSNKEFTSESCQWCYCRKGVNNSSPTRSLQVSHVNGATAEKHCSFLDHVPTTVGTGYGGPMQMVKLFFWVNLSTDHCSIFVKRFLSQCFFFFFF